MKHLLFISIILFSHLGVVLGQKYTVSGYVQEEHSLEKLPGAIIKVVETNEIIVTNEYGYYAISLDAAQYNLETYVPGFIPQIDAINVNGDVKLDIFMKLEGQLEEVEVVARKSGAQVVGMGNHQIEITDIKSVPSLLGEKDVFKVLKLMPGVQKGQEGSSGFNVRGGGTDQNLIILDDAVVYNASHLFGFFSTFNGDALKSVELIKGGYPAKYGERLSSVLNMTMREGNKKYYTGELGVGILSSRFTFEGPILKDKASFLVSGRRSYADILAQPFLIRESIMGGYYFYDLNAKVNYQIDEKNSIYLSGYFGRDRFYMRNDFFSQNDNGKFNFGWGNATGTARWNHVISQKMFANLTFNYSQYNLSTRLYSKVNNEEFMMRYISSIQDLGLKYDVNYYLNNRHQLKFGYKITHHLFKPNAITTEINQTIDTNYTQVNKYNSVEQNIYIDDEWKVNSDLSMNVGLRGSSFSTKDKTYFNIEPRFSARYLINSSTSVKGSYTIMNQYMHLLSSTGINLPTDLWIPATSKIAPQRATQYSIGIFKDWFDPQLSLSVEGYYKDMKNVVSFKEGASFLTLEDPFAIDQNSVSAFDNQVTSGIGRSYGIEMMLQKPKGRFHGWVSYTWSKTQYKMPEVNNGEWYYPRFDRRHDMSVVGFYDITPKIKLNAVFTFATGNPLNIPQYEIYPSYNNPSNGSVENDDFFQSNLYSSRNDFRSEVYHRMDLGIQFLKEKKRGTRTWEISFYNIYNRKNPFFYMMEYDMDIQSNSLYKYTIFPFIPSITYSYKFK